MRRRWAVALALLLLLLAGVVVAGIVAWKHRHPGTIRGSASTEFDTTQEPGSATVPEEQLRRIPWPTYGFDNARTRSPGFQVRPPFRIAWRRNAGSLLEFPPVVAYGRLYVGTASGRFLALDAKTGKVVWKKEFGRCMAASPAVAGGVVYQTLMDPSPCAVHRQDSAGYLLALDADTGDVLWRFRAGVSESSPLVVDGTVYFGSWDRKMYALDTKTHRVDWRVGTGDKVKDAAAYADGTIYFASYDNKVYAVAAKSGKLRWAAKGVGNFYATPSVAYGRVFIGNTDGRVYAFGAKSGHLLWARSTGGYVYSSAAVSQRTVYVGSYGRRFYAIDAGTGDVRWSFKTSAAVSGAATVLAGLVYFSTLGGHTYALDARTGKKVWSYADGKYTPVSADERTLYFIGEQRVYALEPR
jgi:outer membrane protein assembly factor BamB